MNVSSLFNFWNSSDVSTPPTPPRITSESIKNKVPMLLVQSALDMIHTKETRYVISGVLLFICAIIADPIIQLIERITKQFLLISIDLTSNKLSSAITSQYVLRLARSYMPSVGKTALFSTVKFIYTSSVSTAHSAAALAKKIFFKMEELTKPKKKEFYFEKALDNFKSKKIGKIFLGMLQCIIAIFIDPLQYLFAPHLKLYQKRCIKLATEIAFSSQVKNLALKCLPKLAMNSLKLAGNDVKNVFNYFRGR